ncbi:hypothetical protein H4R20_000757 [Coemansia guatemalensis]|uniref:Uncharacterized protein n=1 Tax=Coemansia guatemalensis TaxID=2761395 RepID=A0A9W8I0J4_9FUNG|nr:hypothetical protein H4R20_000757 [Coemansia guatemalensis]
MAWDSFRHRVRYLRGEALSNWPVTVVDVHLQNITVPRLPQGRLSKTAAAAGNAKEFQGEVGTAVGEEEESLGVHVWCTCAIPAQGQRKSTLMHSVIPSSGGSRTGKAAEGGEVERVPVAEARSVWMDSDSGVNTTYDEYALRRALRFSAVEHSLWAEGEAEADRTPSVVVVADKGRQWVEGHIDYGIAGETHVRFSESGGGRGRGAGDWYYARGGRGGRFVAFVREGNVVVYDTSTQRETQVTWAAGGAVQYGAVEVAMEEELGRATGLFWAPTAEVEGMARLLCGRVDEREVQQVQLPELPEANRINPAANLVGGAAELFTDDAFGWDSGGVGGTRASEPHRYARAGTTNAATEWAVVELTHNAAGIARHRVRALHGRFGLRRRFPWCEYVARAGWLPDGDAVWLQLLDRAQQRTAVVRVALACFCAGEERAVDPLACDDTCCAAREATDARIDVLYEESQPHAWINVSHGPRFLATGTRSTCVRFLMTSEREGGFSHLYLVTWQLVRDGAAAWQATALTSGRWAVESDAALFVDERRQLVYFGARRPNPLTLGLFATGYAHALTDHPTNPPAAPVALTLAGYTHSQFAFDASGTYFFCQSSNLATPPRACVYRIRHRSGVRAQCVCVLEVGAVGLRRVSSARTANVRVARRASSSASSLSADSIASDDFFVERLLAKLRAGGAQLPGPDLSKLRRLTPAYVSQRVTKAVRSALPFCSTPTIVPLHLLHGGLFPPLAAQRSKPPPSPRAPPLPPRPLSSLTAATRVFTARETLTGTHDISALPATCQSGDPVPRLFCFPAPRTADGNDSAAYDLLFGHVFLPPDFRPGVAYPVIVHAYGGPQCQLVTSGFPYPRYRRLAMLTRMAPEPPQTRPESLMSLPASECDAPDDAASDSRSLFASAESTFAGLAAAEAARQPSIAESIHRQLLQQPGLRACTTAPPLSPPPVAVPTVQPMVVVCIDGRGTPHRGLHFESTIRGRLGQLEVDDIVCALEYLCHYGLACLAPTTAPPPHWCRSVISSTLAEAAPGASVPPVLRPPVFPPPTTAEATLNQKRDVDGEGKSMWDPLPAATDMREGAMAHRRFVDRARIAIHGWSFGGYVTLRALATRPEWFRVAIAGAPVVRWDWYSAAYVERYLGVLPLPEDSSTNGCSPEAQHAREVYAKASITSVADRLPKDPNRLLLVHGWGDDNVHVAHSAELVRELQRSRPHFPIRLAVYANERHGLRQPASNEHFETLLAFWLFHSLQL